MTAIWLAACSDNDGSPQAPTATLEGSATPTATAFKPTPTMPAGVRFEPSTVLLVDARTGIVTTLIEDPDNALFDVKFGAVAGTVEISGRNGKVIDFTGKVLGGPVQADDCLTVSGSVEVAGRSFKDVTCGVVSPDGRFMLYKVDAGMTEVANGRSVAVWDNWLLDLQTDGRKLLQAGLRHCGGCDGKFGPEWSASSRYIFFSELYGSDRLFVSDAISGTTQELNEPINATGLENKPVWSPVADLLLRPAGNGASILEDLNAGTRRELSALTWPSRFDSTGAYLYSPAYLHARETHRETRIVEVASGRLVATLAGAPGFDRFWVKESAVVGVADGFIVALEGAPDCGLAIYAGATRTCFADGLGAIFSPDTRQIVFARRTGDTGRLNTPSMQASNTSVYEVVLFDLGSKRQIVVARNAIGEWPPRIRWNAEGTHVLVYWPYVPPIP